MFKIINQINNVLSFIISPKNLFYVDKNKSLFKNNAIINSGVDTFCYDFVEEDTIYVKDENTFINNLIIEEKTYLRNSKNLSSRTILLDGEYNSLSDGFECNYYLYDILNKKLNRIANFRNLRNHLNKNKYLYLSNNTHIHTYSLPDATSLWQYDLSELGEFVDISNKKQNYEVKFFLGVCKDALVVQLSNASFIWLDTNTGELMNFLCINSAHPLPKPVFYDDSYKAHISENNLIFLNNQRLLIIDMLTFEVKIIKDYFTQARENQYRFMHSNYFDGRLYFVADYGWQYVTPSYVGVIDAKTGEVLWYKQLEKTGGLSEAPQVTEDKLYVRTNNNVLYVFEKE